MNLPSRTGLLVSRICTGTQRALLASLVIYWLYKIHVVFAALAVVALAGWWLVTLSIRTFNRHRDQEWVKRNPNLKDSVSDYWQNKWLTEARVFDLKTGDEWRVAEATGIMIVAMSLLSLFMRWSAPGSAPTAIQSVWLVFLFSFTLGPALGSHHWYRRNPVSRGDDPDGGLSGVGARLVPPPPILQAGERKQI